MTKWERDMLDGLLWELRCKALQVGRYPRGATWADRKRHHRPKVIRRGSDGVYRIEQEGVPFRCIAWGRLRLQITALERVLAVAAVADRGGG